MSLKDRIQDDMKAALRAGEKQRLTTVRLVLAAIKQREIDERVTLDDAGVLQVLGKMVKQRRDSISQYQAGGREDLAAGEAAEIEILETYLPEPLSEEEIGALIEAAIADTGASSLRDMGKVMGRIKSQAQGRADMGQISARIKARLSSL